MSVKLLHKKNLTKKVVPKIKKNVSIRIRLTDNEYQQIIKKADKYADGNVSYFMRWVALNYGK